MYFTADKYNYFLLQSLKYFYSRPNGLNASRVTEYSTFAMIRERTVRFSEQIMSRGQISEYIFKPNGVCLYKRRFYCNSVHWFFL